MNLSLCERPVEAARLKTQAQQRGPRKGAHALPLAFPADRTSRRMDCKQSCKQPASKACVRGSPEASFPDLAKELPGSFRGLQASSRHLYGLCPGGCWSSSSVVVLLPPLLLLILLVPVVLVVLFLLPHRSLFITGPQILLAPLRETPALGPNWFQRCLPKIAPAPKLTGTLGFWSPSFASSSGPAPLQEAILSRSRSDYGSATGLPTSRGGGRRRAARPQRTSPFQCLLEPGKLGQRSHRAAHLTSAEEVDQPRATLALGRVDFTCISSSV